MAVREAVWRACQMCMEEALGHLGQRQVGNQHRGQPAEEGHRWWLEMEEAAGRCERQKQGHGNDSQ